MRIFHIKSIQKQIHWDEFISKKQFIYISKFYFKFWLLRRNDLGDMVVFRVLVVELLLWEFIVKVIDISSISLIGCTRWASPVGLAHVPRLLTSRHIYLKEKIHLIVVFLLIVSIVEVIDMSSVSLTSNNGCPRGASPIGLAHVPWLQTSGHTYLKERIPNILYKCAYET